MQQEAQTFSYEEKSDSLSEPTKKNGVHGDGDCLVASFALSLIDVFFKELNATNTKDSGVLSSDGFDDLIDKLNGYTSNPLKKKGRLWPTTQRKEIFNGFLAEYSSLETVKKKPRKEKLALISQGKLDYLFKKLASYDKELQEFLDCQTSYSEDSCHFLLGKLEQLPSLLLDFWDVSLSPAVIILNQQLRYQLSEELDNFNVSFTPLNELAPTLLRQSFESYTLLREKIEKIKPKIPDYKKNYLATIHSGEDLTDDFFSKEKSSICLELGLEEDDDIISALLKGFDGDEAQDWEHELALKIMTGNVDGYQKLAVSHEELLKIEEISNHFHEIYIKNDSLKNDLYWSDYWNFAGRQAYAHKIKTFAFWLSDVHLEVLNTQYRMNMLISRQENPEISIQNRDKFESEAPQIYITFDAQARHYNPAPGSIENFNEHRKGSHDAMLRHELSEPIKIISQDSSSISVSDISSSQEKAVKDEKERTSDSENEELLGVSEESKNIKRLKKRILENQRKALENACVRSDENNLHHPVNEPPPPRVRPGRVIGYVLVVGLLLVLGILAGLASLTFGSPLIVGLLLFGGGFFGLGYVALGGILAFILNKFARFFHDKKVETPVEIVQDVEFQAQDKDKEEIIADLLFDQVYSSEDPFVNKNPHRFEEELLGFIFEDGKGRTVLSESGAGFVIRKYLGCESHVLTWANLENEANDEQLKVNAQEADPSQAYKLARVLIEKSQCELSNPKILLKLMNHFSSILDYTFASDRLSQNQKTALVANYLEAIFSLPYGPHILVLAIKKLKTDPSTLMSCFLNLPTPEGFSQRERHFRFSTLKEHCLMALFETVPLSFFGNIVSQVGLNSQSFEEILHNTGIQINAGGLASRFFTDEELKNFILTCLTHDFFGVNRNLNGQGFIINMLLSAKPTQRKMVVEIYEDFLKKNLQPYNHIFSFFHNFQEKFYELKKEGRVSGHFSDYLETPLGSFYCATQLLKPSEADQIHETGLGVFAVYEKPPEHIEDTEAGKFFIFEDHEPPTLIELGFQLRRLYQDNPGQFNDLISAFLPFSEKQNTIYRLSFFLSALTEAGDVQMKYILFQVIFRCLEKSHELPTAQIIEQYDRELCSILVELSKEGTESARFQIENLYQKSKRFLGLNANNLYSRAEIVRLMRQSKGGVKRAFKALLNIHDTYTKILYPEELNPDFRDHLHLGGGDLPEDMSGIQKRHLLNKVFRTYPNNSHLWFVACKVLIRKHSRNRTYQLRSKSRLLKAIALLKEYLDNRYTPLEERRAIFSLLRFYLEAGSRLDPNFISKIDGVADSDKKGLFSLFLEDYLNPVHIPENDFYATFSRFKAELEDNNFEFFKVIQRTINDFNDFKLDRDGCIIFWGVLLNQMTLCFYPLDLTERNIEKICFEAFRSVSIDFYDLLKETLKEAITLKKQVPKNLGMIDFIPDSDLARDQNTLANDYYVNRMKKNTLAQAQSINSDDGIETWVIEFAKLSLAAGGEYFYVLKACEEILDKTLFNVENKHLVLTHINHELMNFNLIFYLNEQLNKPIAKKVVGQLFNEKENVCYLITYESFEAMCNRLAIFIKVNKNQDVPMEKVFEWFEEMLVEDPKKSAAFVSYMKRYAKKHWPEPLQLKLDKSILNYLQIEDQENRPGRITPFDLGNWNRSYPRCSDTGILFDCKVRSELKLYGSYVYNLPTIAELLKTMLYVGEGNLFGIPFFKNHLHNSGGFSDKDLLFRFVGVLCRCSLFLNEDEDETDKSGMAFLATIYGKLLEIIPTRVRARYDFDSLEKAFAESGIDVNELETYAIGGYVA